jgi:hypothetical protein
VGCRLAAATPSTAARGVMFLGAASSFERLGSTPEAPLMTRPIIAKSVTNSLAKLSHDDARLAKLALADLVIDAAYPGLKQHPVQGRDPNMWSARVNDDIRIIMNKRQAETIFCYVAHHDDDALMRIAVPRAWTPAICAATPDEFLEIGDDLPDQAKEIVCSRSRPARHLRSRGARPNPSRIATPSAGSRSSRRVTTFAVAHLGVRVTQYPHTSSGAFSHRPSLSSSLGAVDRQQVFPTALAARTIL